MAEVPAQQHHYELVMRFSTDKRINVITGLHVPMKIASALGELLGLRRFSAYSLELVPVLGQANAGRRVALEGDLERLRGETL